MDHQQYDQIADQFIKGKQAFFQNEPDYARDFIVDSLKDKLSKKVLDMGCGAGDLPAVLESMGIETVYGMDPSAKMIELAKTVVAHPENMQIGKFESIPLEDGAIDVIVGRFSLHYAEDLDRAYSEIARVLSPRGEMVMAVSHPTADFSEERFLKGEIPYVRTRLYDGAVSIQFPLHRISEYFSDVFLHHFDLIQVKEWTRKDREYQLGPNGLAFVARKRY